MYALVTCFNLLLTFGLLQSATGSSIVQQQVTVAASVQIVFDSFRLGTLSVVSLRGFSYSQLVSLCVTAQGFLPVAAAVHRTVLLLVVHSL